jgi:hypothetical protein
MSANSAQASVDQSSPSKVPLLLAGDISPSIMREFKDGCQAYFDQKAVDAKMQVRMIVPGIRDCCIRDWITADRDHIYALSFADFMSKFCTNYLKPDWEATTRHELLGMTQGSQTFWNFQAAVKSKNSLLFGTKSYLAEDKLRHQIEAAIDANLARKCDSEKVDKVVDFKEWLNEVKRVDENIRAERREFELIAKAGRESNRCQNNTLMEPSRRANTNTTTATSSSSISTRTNSFKTCPRLMPAECQLLYDNEGCLKCRCVFCNHISKHCLNGFPNADNYKVLTQADVDRAKCNRPQAVAAVASRSSFKPTQELEIHPVATVMSMTHPVAYVVSNTSNVISDGVDTSGSDQSTVSADHCMPLPPNTTGNPLAKGHSVDAVTAPFHVAHLFWNCVVNSNLHDHPVHTNALIDHGSHAVLIREDLVEQLGLRRRCLPKPEKVELAMSQGDVKVEVDLTEWVKLKLHDPSFFYSAWTVRAIIAPGLCSPVILGLPFLVHNRIIVDHECRTVIDKASNFDLLNPVPPLKAKPPKRKLKDLFKQVQADHKLMVSELNMVCSNRLINIKQKFEQVQTPDVVGAIRQRMEVMAAQQKLADLGKTIINEYADVFAPIPHIDELPTDIYCRIRLKDTSKSIHARSYSTPQKYRDAWKTLIQQHLDAGRIRPSNSAHASPAFLVPKADHVVLPRWVNDYHMLNANTVLDAHPLPRVDDILSDCAKGKIWSKLDMTNSFFQTRVHPDDVHLTAVSTPFGLFEWLAMPMGLRNSPPIHQRRVTAALREYIGKICHIYLDDIIIWSQTIEEHHAHVRLVMEALQKARLYCNPKKCEFYLLEVDFLGHHISTRGIEANSSKVEHVLDWPVPKNATDVRSFLGLVRYIAHYLPQRADFTVILTPLTTKESRKCFPEWTVQHQHAFEAIKALVVSRECLTVIDHDNPGDNNVYVTCDASDWRTGATLSFSPTWKSARPVAFDSMQLKGAERNYPVHEKELLAIIRALKKWRSDLLGMNFFVYTDHRTLQNFDTQRDLSRRQLRWQEFLSQYDMAIVYIPGKANSVADALSRVAPNAFPDEHDPVIAPHTVWANNVSAVLRITTDTCVLKDIKMGYREDEFCKKLISNPSHANGICCVNDLWYVGDRLLIPRYGEVRENLFRLAHNNSGHFGSDKAYALLRDAYYWLNMRRDLEKSYIPSCADCQHNKSSTKKSAGPLCTLYQFLITEGTV